MTKILTFFLEMVGYLFVFKIGQECKLAGGFAMAEQPGSKPIATFDPAAADQRIVTLQEMAWHKRSLYLKLRLYDGREGWGMIGNIW
jgi:hypothetical protein